MFQWLNQKFYSRVNKEGVRGRYTKYTFVVQVGRNIHGKERVCTEANQGRYFHSEACQAPAA